MQIDPNFMDNILRTSQTNNLVKSDGKAFTIGDHIRDIFHSLLGIQSAKDQFLDVCATLTMDDQLKKFEQLEITQQFDILYYIDRIKKRKFNNLSIGDSSTIELTRTDLDLKMQLNKENIKSFTESILLNLKEAEENRNLDKFKHTFRKIDDVVTLSEMYTDQNIREAAKNMWKQVYNQAEKTNYLEEKNEWFPDWIEVKKERSRDEINRDTSDQSESINKIEREKRDEEEEVSKEWSINSEGFNETSPLLYRKKKCTIL